MKVYFRTRKVFCWPELQVGNYGMIFEYSNMSDFDPNALQIFVSVAKIFKMYVISISSFARQGQACFQTPEFPQDFSS